MMTYNVLIFDDDPSFLDLLEEKICKLNDNGNKYFINVYKTSYSREALNIANSVVFDIIVLDICRKPKTDTLIDKYDYQGYELYEKIIECHPDWESHTNFIVLSNLTVETAKKTFNYKNANYLHKDDYNCKSVAQIIKAYIDSDYNKTTSIINNANLDFEILIKQVEDRLTKDLNLDNSEFAKKLLQKLKAEYENNNLTKNALNKYKNYFDTFKSSVELTAAITSLIEFLTDMF